MQQPQPGKEGSTEAKLTREQQAEEAKAVARLGYDSVTDMVDNQGWGHRSPGDKAPDDNFHWIDNMVTNPFNLRTGERVYVSVRTTEPVTSPAPEGGRQPDSIEVTLWQQILATDETEPGKWGAIASAISPLEGDPMIELGDYGHQLYPDKPDHELAPVIKGAIEEGHVQSHKLRAA